MRTVFLKISSGIAGALLLAACSSDDIASTTDAVNIAEAMQPSEVEISLFASGAPIATRASIESTPNAFGGYSFNTNKNDTLGFLMMAVGYTPNLKDVNQAPIKWEGTWAQNKKGQWYHAGFDEEYSIYLNNAEVGVTYDGGVGISRLHWMGTPTPHSSFSNGKAYYPLGSLHKYAFYAYNPRVDTLTYETNRVTAVMRNLDGSQDVIWGYLEPDPNDTYAYSADYFRQASQRIPYAGDLPVTPETPMVFSHKMMRLTFSIQAGAEDESSQPIDTLRNYDKAYQTKVHSISIINVPDEVQLVVADKTQETKDEDGNITASSRKGQLSYSSSRNKTYYLKEKRTMVNKNGATVNLIDSVLTPVAPVPADAEYKTGNRDKTNVPAVTNIGQGIILPALNDNDRVKNPYKMLVVLEYPKGTFRKKVFSLNAPYGEFKAGYSYHLALKIYCPDQVNMSASSTPWEIISDKDIENYTDPVAKKDSDNKTTKK